MAKIEANNVIFKGKIGRPELGSLCVLQSRPPTLQGCRWSLLLQLMVNWGSSEPWSSPWGCRAARYSSMCGKLGFSLRRHAHLVFDHFHSDHQAFSTDVSDDLILVSEFGQFCHEMGAHVEAVLLQTVLSDSLWKETARLFTVGSKRNFSHSRAARGIECLISSTGAIYSHIQHRGSDGSGHWVSSKGVEVNGLAKRGCNFWKTRESK